MVRTYPTFRSVLLLSAVAVFVAGCDTVLPPFMRNALATPIDVRIAYTNGVVTHDTWQPGIEVACGRANALPVSLSVTSAHHVLHHLDQAQITAIFGSVSDIRKIIWEIRQHAIVPVASR